ncbi:MAG TPA: hypothetical protein VGR76_04785 [Candidatus Angelobacter sp.]|nr:hypothetical protein [Candidatus Angelobacter sp.]
MAVSITDRLTAAIRIAEQSIEHAQYQADYRNWHEVHRVLQDARDELNKPVWIDSRTTVLQRTMTAAEIKETYGLDVNATAQPVKLDGRTKEARALKAQQ